MYKKMQFLDTKKWISYVLSLCFLTQLRGLVTFLFPFFCKGTCYLFNCRVRKQFWWLLFIISLSSIVGLFTGTVDVSNVFLYFWFSIPLLYLQFSEYTSSSIQRKRWETLFPIFIKTVKLIDIIGFFCLFFIYKTQDDFGRPYGSTFKGVSGLAFVNGILVLYFFAKFLKGQFLKKDYYDSIFFLISHILCFSALTSITLLLALFVYFFRKLSIKNIIFGLLILFSSIFILKMISPETVEYNVAKLSYVFDNNQDKARKIVMYNNYFKYLKEDFPRSILCGCGPGGFNSRTAFLLNQDSENLFTTILGHHKPYYHEKYIHPLWDLRYVSLENFNDGATNKPFSSIIDFAAELGLFFLVIYVLTWLSNIRKLLKLAKRNYVFLFCFLMNVFVFISLFTEYWFQSTEYLLFLIIQACFISSLKKYRYDS